MNKMKQIEKAVRVLEKECGKADIAIVLGSGLGDFGNELTNTREVPYEKIPGFPTTTVPGHAGKFIFGDLAGKRVMLMSGRFHSYEGYSMDEGTLPIRIMSQLGIKNLILTNAAGGVNTSFPVGCLMLITDFINLSGRNPLRGKNMDTFGPRFPDMTNAYSPALRALALESAEELGMKLEQGVYCWMNGPCYETPAEIRMCRILGADAVGMSPVPETIVARHCGINVMGISCITNMAAGVLDQPINHEEVIETGKRVRNDFANLLKSVVEKM